MKKYIIWFVFPLLLMVAACVPFRSKNQVSGLLTPTTDDIVETTEEMTPDLLVEQLTLIDIQNMKVYAPFFQTSVQLKDGQFSRSDADSELNVYLLDQFALGDLNGDGLQEGVALISENGGGTGWFTSLIIIDNQNGQSIQVDSAGIDDRPLIESLLIDNGEVILKAKIHRINDPMVDPTYEIIRIYRLVDGHLVCISQSSVLEDGSERKIEIDHPQTDNSVTNPVQITGGMTISPFENSLALRVCDLSGTLLFETGFMVDSLDLGLPATFDNSVSLDGVPANEWLQLELAELSMADGSVMVSDSVLIKITE